jgi:SAM-dependent methyltransferase
MIDLSAYPLRDGIRVISPPQSFDGDEALYDATIGAAHAADALASGRGALQLALRHGERPIESVLEIGAGGGTCSVGLVEGGVGRHVLITDTSPGFLRMVRAKLAHLGKGSATWSLATLAGEDLALLPAESVDAIVIASALHHVGNWRGFFADAAGLLRPGAVLVIQEPCREGNLMMGMALDIVLSPLWPVDASLPAEDTARIERCRDSIYLLANSHVEKLGEDKHSFLVSALAEAAGDAGFSRSFLYANAHFQDLADTDLSARHGSCSFVGYLDSFLEQHHRVSREGMEVLRARLFPVLGRIDQAFRDGDGAPLFGCMVFRKEGLLFREKEAKSF